MEERYTAEEFEALPLVLTTKQVARLIGSNERYVSNHATELHGRKIAGRWTFPKQQIARLIGIEDEG